MGRYCTELSVYCCCNFYELPFERSLRKQRRLHRNTDLKLSGAFLRDQAAEAGTNIRDCEYVVSITRARLAYIYGSPG